MLCSSFFFRIKGEKSNHATTGKNHLKTFFVIVIRYTYWIFSKNILWKEIHFISYWQKLHYPAKKTWQKLSWFHALYFVLFVYFKLKDHINDFSKTAHTLYCEKLPPIITYPVFYLLFIRGRWSAGDTP